MYVKSCMNESSHSIASWLISRMFVRVCICCSDTISSAAGNNLLCYHLHSLSPENLITSCPALVGKLQLRPMWSITPCLQLLYYVNHATSRNLCHFMFPHVLQFRVLLVLADRLLSLSSRIKLVNYLLEWIIR